LSLRHLEERMVEPGIAVNPIRPFIAGRTDCCRYWKNRSGCVNARSAEVGGWARRALDAWQYLYRAADKAGNTVDFLLRARWGKAAAQAYFDRAIALNGDPETVTIDKSGSNLTALKAINAKREMPIQVDIGSEFISHALYHWAYKNGVMLDFSRPGKPTDYPFIESFDGSFRDECLNVHWFMSLDDVRDKIEQWRQYYNEFRPHSSLDNLTPCEFPLAHLEAGNLQVNVLG